MIGTAQDQKGKLTAFLAGKGRMATGADNTQKGDATATSKLVEQVEVVTPSAINKPQWEEVLIPIDQIARDPNQPRTRFVKKKIEGLARSIKKYGLRKAIEVRPVKLANDPKIKYMIVDGECRWRAHKLIGKSEIRASIDESGITLREAYVSSVILNFHKTDHTPVEIAMIIGKLLRDGVAVEEMVDIFGHKPSWIAKYRKLLKLSSKVQETMNPELPEDQQIMFPVAILLANLPHALQETVAEEIISEKRSMVSAKALIRSRAHEVGIKFRGKSNSSEGTFSSMRRFVEAASERIDAFIALPDEIVDRMGKYRSTDELDNLDKEAVSVIAKLESLRRVIAKARATNTRIG